MSLTQEPITTFASNGHAKTEAPPAPQGLKGRRFRGLIRTDRTPERVPFVVETDDGRELECWVDLVPMDKDDRNQFVAEGGDDIAAGVVSANTLKAFTFLVGRTVVDFQFWMRPMLRGGGHGEWQQVRPPDNANRRWFLEWFRDHCEALPEFWDALCVECARVSGLSEDASGNLPTPSPS